MQSVSALLLNSRSENKRMAVLPVQTVKTNQCFWKKNAQNTLTMFYDGLVSNLKVENLKSHIFIRST